MISFKFLTIAVLVEAVVSTSNIPLGPPNVRTRVVKGYKAKLGQFPWHAHLQIKGKSQNTYLCGGSLIARSWVVTAAHCLKPADKVAIGLGITNSVTHDFVTRAKRFMCNENFDSKTLQNDIGLIQLSQPAPMTKLIRIIELLPKSLEDHIVPGLTGTVSGFGRMNNNNDKMPIVLLWLTVRIIPNQDCGKVFGPKYISDNKFCANGDKIDQNICDGDSGGGMVVTIKNAQYLAAITSFGRVGKCVGAPSGYQKVIPYLDWIRSTMTT